MANSEGEDFESADEEVVKVHKKDSLQSQSSIVSYSSSENQSSDSSTFASPLIKDSSSSISAIAYQASPSAAEKLSGTVSQETSIAASQNTSLSNKNVGDSAPAALPHNPESLGAKPKVFLKSKSKSHSKQKIRRDVMDGAACVLANSCSNYPNNSDGTQKRRLEPMKLGVKILPQEPLTHEVASSENNKCKKEKGKVTWSSDSSDPSNGNQDVHDSIQPLLDKLAGLDVVDPPDQVANSSSEKSGGGWGLWGTWGMNSIISGASSVSSHVTQGISTMSSVIESGLGVIDPQEMAKISVEANKTLLSETSQSLDSSSHVIAEQDSPEKTSLNVMGNVLKFVESTGEMIVSSGLNTLESLGKKTMDVLQEGDPGLKKKRALFSRECDKPTLSQVLKEARSKADIEDKERAQAKKAAKAHFETLFDDYRGMIHLEALEMLSNTCQLKLEAKLLALSGAPLVEFQRSLIQVKELCDIPDDDDEDDEDRGSIEILERDLSAAMRGLMVPVSHSKLIRVSEDTDAWLATMKCMQDEDSQNENDEWVDEEDLSEDSDPQSALHEIHQQAIRSLARLTAAVAEHFHKTAELLLLKEEHNSQVECHCVVMMTSVLCSRVSSVAARFSELLSASANMLDSAQVDHNDVNSLITNVFLEASNSSSYIQDASLLLIPVLQLGAVQ